MITIIMGMGKTLLLVAVTDCVLATARSVLNTSHALFYLIVLATM
jgi:hypothetical protein